MNPLAWMLLTVSLWTSGSSQILQQGPIKTFYPTILSKQSIECDCTDTTCDYVYWFRSNYPNVEYLGKCNNADRVTHGTNVDKTRFIMNRRSSSSYVLHIINVTEEDAGVYSCVSKDKKNTETWKPGVLIRPGVTPPTLPPTTTTKRPVKPVCRCSKKSPQDGCHSLVLWPLVGLTAALALCLMCTLYYFSRLPKKCRHNFVKAR